MLRRSRCSMQEVSVGDNVRIGIPDVDRSRIENRNLICVVIQIDGDCYILGCRHGPLHGRFSRNQVDLCRAGHLSLTDVPERSVTVREAARAQSGGERHSRDNREMLELAITVLGGAPKRAQDLDFLKSLLECELDELVFELVSKATAIVFSRHLWYLNEKLVALIF
ncbi:uncharacterized protein LOC122386989 [Amphibalanus amphitrite]|uniref:uncharacterized protein LOC122386989 n=1 Tax=Amphibalanus amphitrite TaxID=1232801 RepID=UPI001C915FF7|nr:uncharacterized protein LOC122386989 [Amphibalanus amphitrite]